jgi:SsrA-binding protein
MGSPPVASGWPVRYNQQAMKPDTSRKVISTNKDARFRYFITETIEAGIVLVGTEVKSLRVGKVQMADAYVFVKNGQAFLSNMHIPEYTHGNRLNHDPLRERKLLMHRHQIDKLAAAVNEQGMSVVPTEMYFLKGHAKIELGLGKGKKLHDKRASIKDKESKREMDRALKR